MAGLLDFAQAASNSTAQNVAGPIDSMAWALRKMGLPIPDDPVLGAEWMRRHGLIVDVPKSPYSIAGETAGLLAPVLFAPGGLLKGK